MTTTFVPSPWSTTTWRRLAIGTTALAIMLLVALTTVLVVGSSTGTGPQFGGGASYDPACQPTAVIHIC
jgi:hypothetical protein